MLFNKNLFRKMHKISKNSNYISPLITKPLDIDGNGNLKERETGRIFHIHGINFASNTKMPDMPLQSTHLDAGTCGLYENADSVTFVGKPFPLSEGYEHFSRIKQCGFNTIRFVTTWEAIEHEGPGIYDLEYVEYVTKMIKMIDEIGGLYVFIDPHQDVWSRFSGGSGAPIWTFYAAGLEPCNFEKTFAAKIHNLANDPQKYTKMVWATNYSRLASQVMFTLFFSGSIFTPKAKIDDVNIEEYLQNHFIEAYAFLMNHLKNEIPEVFDRCLLGIESMNEPNNGLYGLSDLNTSSEDERLKLDEMPTPIQSLRLGMGIPEEVDMYSLSLVGPIKTGTKWCDSNGRKAWVTEDNNKDSHYGFRRSANWKLGECLFAQHGVWDSVTGRVILPDYFKVHPENGKLLSETTFINGPFLKFWYKFKERMREIDSNMFLIVEPPVLQIPPLVRNNKKYLDDRTLVAVHYYDGMSLMFQKWNRFLNADTLGIMRGRYFNPVFALVLGETNIRKSIRRQIKSMATECNENMGFNIPVIFTETGMPFNMDNKKSYDDGNYDSQEGANDAILSALENEQLNFTYWCYNPENCHEWGDLWNLEDFSIWSKDDQSDTKFVEGNTYSEWLNNNFSIKKHINFNKNISDHNNNDNLEIESSNSLSDTSISKKLVKETTYHYKDNYGLPESSSSSNEDENLDNNYINLTDGVRAINSIIRPVPVLVNGDVKKCQFDYKNKSFHLEIINSRFQKNEENSPDIILIPMYHYYDKNFQVKVSNGIFCIRHNPVIQWIEWDHSRSEDRIVKLDIKLIEKAKGKESGCGESLKALACGYFTI